MKAAVLIVVCFAFGAIDQYIGSLASLSWGASASLLSAPWLLVAFIAGWPCRGARSAMVLGLLCTYAALLGYGFMTLSPVEDAHLTVQSALAFCRSERLALIGALITGPLFGWFGFRWGRGRGWVGALVTALAFVLEPTVNAHERPGAVTAHGVIELEVTIGALMAGYVILALAWRHHPRAGTVVGAAGGEDG